MSTMGGKGEKKQGSVFGHRFPFLVRSLHNSHTDLAFLDPGLGSKKIPTLDNFGVVATIEK